MAYLIQVTITVLMTQDTLTAYMIQVTRTDMIFMSPIMKKRQKFAALSPF